MDSGILYSAVAKGNVILVSSQRVSEDFESVTKTFLPTVPSGFDTKTCFQSVPICSCIQKTISSIAAVKAAPTDFGRNIPYAFLNKIKERFTCGSLVARAFTAMEHEFDRDFSRVLDEEMERYAEDVEIDGIGKVKNQVSEVMDVMRNNIEKVVEREGKLDLLIDKANELECSSAQLKSTAKKVRRKMWCKNMKMWIIIMTILAVIITLIVLASTNVIPLKG